MNCPKCDIDISESYQGAEPDVGIMSGGWYCDACDLAVSDEDGYEPRDDDVQIFGAGTVHDWKSPTDRPSDGRCQHCQTELEMGYGLAGGGMGPYMYCPNEHCKKPTFVKSQDPI